MTSSVKTYYLLDLDRTIFDTIGASDLLIAIVAEHSGELAHRIRTQIDEYNQIGASFAIRDVIVEQVGEERALDIEHAFIREGRSRSLLLPGARELMDSITRRDDATFGILTYGSIKGQRMKITAAGLQDVPCMITQQKHKGELIASWKQPDGYHIPSELGDRVASEIVFVDDRIFSFEGLPEEVIGYWITEELAALDAVEHAMNVHPVRTLHEVIEREARRHDALIDKA